ncbi:GNAT family N-acetyltransferase [Cyanobacterium sp. IPPAS B-1200]|uniref:GNAT family N-acetyltransferase n=1 Tax=Cyanobacterium sp. IPPAS B-1200 TaxID=1562720 RepID=UPI0008525197|nr:GNAT family N-acetyltransferase [Cyanobacterium sp. IPPAS B-1200]
MTSSLSFSHHNHSSSCCPIIRLATSEDIRQIADVLTYSFHDFGKLTGWLYPLMKMGIAEDLRDRIYAHNSDYCCIIAVIPATTTEAEKIVGTVEVSQRRLYGWTQKQKFPYISNLAVKKEFRRQGIATQLLKKCEEIAQNWGHDNLSLHVLAENKTGQTVYLQNGYTIKQEETNLYSLFIKNKRRLLLEKSFSNNPE